ncbi:unnamed protein product, partial [Prorocentrum cordatum]
SSDRASVRDLPEWLAMNVGSSGSDAPRAGAADNADTAGAGDHQCSSTADELREQGNAAFRKARLLKRTTAGKQYLQEAKAAYAKAIVQMGKAQVNDTNMVLVCTLHANLAAVFLEASPPEWQSAKAAADLALAVNPRSVKALYRRAQARLEDGREGLPAEAMCAALDDLRCAEEVEPGNEQVRLEAERVARRIAALEEARRVPGPLEIAGGIQPHLLERGGDCLLTHGYVWGQTAERVHVLVPARGLRVPQASCITWELRAQALRVVMPAADPAAPLVLEGRLCRPVRPDDCSWQLEDRGLLLHVELSKRDTSPEAEHWPCVWAGHPETRAPTGEEQERLLDMASAACAAERSEEPRGEAPNANAQETLRRLREMCPGVSVEWGDTSLDDFR